MIELQPDEKIILFKRRHWFAFFSKIIFLAFLLLMFLGSTFFLKESGASLSLIMLISTVLIHLVWIVFFITLADYHLDIWVVTDERVLDIEQKGLFNREFSEFKLNKIQDVTVDVIGVLPTFLHYGDVLIQTAGEARKFTFKQIPHPHEVKSRILKAHDRFVKEGEEPRRENSV